MSNNRKHSVGDGGVLPDPGKKAWPDELKQLAGALIDLAAESLASRRPNLVLVEILTADELSDRFKVPVSTIEELARKGKLPGAFRVGKHWRFDLDLLRTALPTADNGPLDKT
jgi:excisionase family DNA binding protein